MEATFAIIGKAVVGLLGFGLFVWLCLFFWERWDHRP